MKKTITSSKNANKKKTQKVMKVNVEDKFNVIAANSKRRENAHAEAQAVLRDHSERLAAYITSILEPEYAVTEGLVAKQPALFPIPSTSISFRDNVNISTDAEGDFAICWNPNFFTNLSNLTQYSFVNSQGSTNANTALHLFQRDGDKLIAYPSYVPDVAMSKYRLVSAKLKVTYIGSVLQKSGMMYACATYDQTPNTIGHLSDTDPETPLRFYRTDGQEYNWTETGVTAYTQPFKNAVANMTEARISNGIWNKSLNVTNSNQGMSCLHIPTDPINEIFYPIGTYFGGEIPDRSIIVPENPGIHGAVAVPKSFTSTNGAQLCYMVCGHGLPINVECVNIQVYYTFEIIPATTSAPFLRATLDKTTVAERTLVSTVVKEIMPQVAITPSRTNPASWLFDRIKSTMASIDRTNPFKAALQIVPRFLGLF